MPPTPQQQAQTALCVLSGQQTIEQAAQEHGVAVVEIESWCDLLQAGASQAAEKRKRRMRLAGLLAAGLLLVGVTAAVAGPTPCPDPTLPLPAPLKKFCPDAPASGTDLTGNFTQAIQWIEQKGGPIDKPLPSEWISGSQIASGAITGDTIALNQVVSSTTQVSDGSLGNGDLQAGAIDASHVASGVLVPLYENNANCNQTSNYSLSATCTPIACPSSCGSPTLVAMASCTDGCVSPICQPAICNPTQTFCAPSNPLPSCNNTLRGYLLAP